jgi:ribosomal protein S18 acetylase RimI-like enzyme
VGFCQLYPSFSSVNLRRTLVLNDLFVDTEYRGRGVARTLLSAAESLGRRLGALRLTLSTAHSNAPAQALYTSAGWKRDEDFAVFHRPL